MGRETAMVRYSSAAEHRCSTYPLCTAKSTRRLLSSRKAMIKRGFLAKMRNNPSPNP